METRVTYGIAQTKQDLIEETPIEIAEQVELIQPANDHRRKPQVNTRLHGMVWRSLAMLFYGILGVYLWTFWGHGETMFMIGICFFYLTMYLAGPYILMKVQNEKLDDDTLLDEFLEKPFATATGNISGAEAWFQICLIPGALFLLALGMGIILKFSVLPAI